MGYMNYEERLEVAKRLYELSNDKQKTALECIFPELAESKDEKVRKSIIGFLKTISSLKDGKTVSNEDFDSTEILKWAAWLEKQGMSYTKRDVDNAYVEGMALAKNELEKQKPAWSKEDEIMIANIRDDLFCYQTKVRDEDHQLAEDIEKEINWLKSLKERYTWKPSDDQMKALDATAGIVGILTPTGVTLCSLYKDLEKLKGE